MVKTWLCEMTLHPKASVCHSETIRKKELNLCFDTFIGPHIYISDHTDFFRIKVILDYDNNTGLCKKNCVAQKYFLNLS